MRTLTRVSLILVLFLGTLVAAQEDCCCPDLRAARFRVMEWTATGEQEIGTLTFQSWPNTGSWWAEFRDPFGTPYVVEFIPTADPCVWDWRTATKTGGLYCGFGCHWQWYENGLHGRTGYLIGRGQ